MRISPDHGFRSHISTDCRSMVSVALSGSPQGLHDSQCVFIFPIRASDEEACSIITGHSTATLCEIHVSRATSKLNMSQRGLNIPLLYKCNLVGCIYCNGSPREGGNHSQRLGG